MYAKFAELAYLLNFSFGLCGILLLCKKTTELWMKVFPFSRYLHSSYHILAENVVLTWLYVYQV